MAQEMATTEKQEVATGTGTETMRSAALYRPNTDIFELDDHVVVMTDMPGVAPDDVEVTLERRVLTIRGRVSPRSLEGYRRVYAEYGEGDFERVFTLSEDIDQDRIVASHKNGVLTLKLPVAEAFKPKKIAVAVE